MYEELNLLPEEISARTFEQAAKGAMRQMQQEYQLASFVGLKEW